MTDILRIQNLNYKEILTDITFCLQNKTFNILVGSNGSGKSMLVKCIAGLLKYNGEIYINNEIICDENIKELRKKVGILTDISDLFEGKVIDNILYPLINLNYKKGSAKKKVYEISQKLEIEHLLTKNTEMLSISEKKLVLFVCSIIHDPDLIIIDDSLDELDNYNRNNVIKYLKSKNDATVLFITNKDKDIMLADNIIVLEKGKIEFNDTLENILIEEKVLLKAKMKLPFLADLSTKLKSYNLIEAVILNEKEMVDNLWK